MVAVSVPGKVHLIGEHAVVYGRPAILAAVGRRVTVSARPCARVRIEDSQMGSSLDWSVEECLEAGRRARALWREGSRGGDFRALFDHVRGDSFKKAAVGCVLDRLGARGGAALSIGSTIPLGSGLGSSSALSVALAKALSELHGAGLSPEEVNALAFEAERFKHGNPSGGDNTACCHGGLVWFQRGEPDTVLSLRGEVPYELDGFVLVHVGTPERSTGELVSMVRDLPAAVREPRVDAIGRATAAMREALRRRDLPAAGRLIDEAWESLAALGLSTPEADELIARVRAAGGHAKLCGACGGGVMLAWHPRPDRLEEAVRDAGYEPWRTELGAEGMRLEPEGGAVGGSDRARAARAPSKRQR